MDWETTFQEAINGMEGQVTTFAKNNPFST